MLLIGLSALLALRVLANDGLANMRGVLAWVMDRSPPYKSQLEASYHSPQALGK